MMKEDMHIHSNFSDGLNFPEEIVTTAISIGYEKICIVDHVREGTKWVSDFANEVLRLKEKYGSKIEIHSGIEAKVIDLRGNLDLPSDFRAVDFVLAAYHRIPRGAREYLSPQEITTDKERALNLWATGMREVLNNPYVNVIAHPTAIMCKYNIPISEDIIDSILGFSDKCFEINLQHRVPRGKFLAKLLQGKFKISYGSDAHSIDELIFWKEIGLRRR